MPIIEEAVREILPAGTKLAGGASGLGREVIWALPQRTRSPAFPDLRGGELALIATSTLRLLEIDLPEMVSSLEERGVAGMAMVGKATPEVVASADAHHLPLLILPKGTNLYDLADSVTRWVVAKRDQLYQSGLNIYRRLTELSIANRGMPALLEALVETTGLVFVLEDKDFQSRLTRYPAGYCACREDINCDATTREMIKRWLENRPLASSDPPILLVPAGKDKERARIVAPVVVRGRVTGYLSALGDKGELGEMVRLAAARGAAACALEIAKERAVIEAESRLRGDFVEDLLTGSFTSDEVPRSRAHYLGHDLSQPQTVMLFALDPPEGKGKPRQKGLRLSLGEAMAKAMTIRKQPYLVWARGDTAAALCTVGEPMDIVSIKAEAEQIRRNVLALRATPPVSAGIGRYHSGLRGLSVTYQEAKRALTIGQSLFGGNCTTCFGDLGVYRLLFSLQDNPEIRSFYQETLGRLLEYDKRRRIELVKTLATYFACQGNLQRTAEAMYLHRNSLVYRIKRIQEVTGFDLNDGEQCFLLQLALKIHSVMR